MRKMKFSKFKNEDKICPKCDLILVKERNLHNFSTRILKYNCINCGYLFIDKDDDKVKTNCEKNEKLDKNRNIWINKKVMVGLVLILACAIAYNKSYVKNFFKELQKENVGIQTEILKLRENYPSQKNETWFHILSVFNMSVPSVKSIILLHDHDNKTSNCLGQQLVSLYTRGKIINMKEITYQNVDEVQDYGEVLEYYKPIIKKHRIFVTNLQEVSGNIARIFHSLCDDISSDIKPSIFIFTLQYDKSMGNLVPLKRVNKILRTAWRDVAENEIWPLLSRIVRNVVEIISEKNISC